MTEEENKTEAKVKVIMKEPFHDKISWFVQNYEQEIGAFIEGKITKEEIILEDILIPEQEADKGGIEIEGRNLVKLRKEYKDRCKKIIGEWHSHNDMGAFWSGTDEEFIKIFSERKSISVYVVSSKNAGHLVRVEVRKPFFVSIDNVGYELDQTESKIGKVLQKEIKKKIKAPVRKADVSFFNIPNIPNNNQSVDFEDHIGIRRKKEKQINKQLNKMMKFFKGQNVVEIYDLSWYWSESLKDNFKTWLPRIREEAQNSFIVEFSFTNKKKAINGMRKIREYVHGLLLEEDDLRDIEDEFNHSGVGAYGYHNHNGYIN